MAALTAPYDPTEKEGHLIAYPVGAAKRIYKGGLVVVDTTTGYAEAGSDAANRAFVGVAYEDADNSAGAAGALTVRVKKGGAFVYNSVGAAQTDVGKQALLVDDNTAKTAATTNNIPVGQVVEYLSATRLRVRINGAVK
jgi:hypothetical protein